MLRLNWAIIVPCFDIHKRPYQAHGYQTQSVYSIADMRTMTIERIAGQTATSLGIFGAGLILASCGSQNSGIDPSLHKPTGSDVAYSCDGLRRNGNEVSFQFTSRYGKGATKPDKVSAAYVLDNGHAGRLSPQPAEHDAADGPNEYHATFAFPHAKIEQLVVSALKGQTAVGCGIQTEHNLPLS